jgi:hypothetical protein
MITVKADVITPPQTRFLDTIADFVAKSPQSGAQLIRFGHEIDQLTIDRWLEIGYAVADIRSALAFPMIYLATEQAVGRQWEHFCKNLIAEGHRYAAAVKDAPQLKSAYCGGVHIWNMGHGVAGAVAELIAENILGKRGVPPVFFGMFDLVGINAKTLNTPSTYH